MKIKQNYSSSYLISPSINIVNIERTPRDYWSIEYNSSISIAFSDTRHILYIYIYTYTHQSAEHELPVSRNWLIGPPELAALFGHEVSLEYINVSVHPLYWLRENTEDIPGMKARVRARARAMAGRGEGGRRREREGGGIAGGADSAVPCKRKPTSWLSSYLR